jgi:hypothetical protein
MDSQLCDWCEQLMSTVHGGKDSLLAVAFHSPSSLSSASHSESSSGSGGGPYVQIYMIETRKLTDQRVSAALFLFCSRCCFGEARSVLQTARRYLCRALLVLI